MSDKYNGWANWETWLFNLHYENLIYDTLRQWAEEDYDDIFADENENNWEDIFCHRYARLLQDEMIEMVFDPISQSIPSGYVVDVLSHTINCIDWNDITSSYAYDILDEIKLQKTG